MVRKGFDVQEYTNIALEEAEKKLNSTIRNAKNFAKGVSPVDTGEYINSFETDNAVKINSNTVRAKLRNTDEKASRVEFGWRKRDVVWSKQGGNPVVEVGKGAKVFRKTQDFIVQDLKK